MRIINIDAPKELVKLFFAAGYHIPDSIQKLLDKFETNYYRYFKDYQDFTTCHISLTPSHSPVWKFECGKYENIAVLWHTIPIYLRGDDKRPIPNHRQHEEKRIVDPLGAYISYGGNATPYIELYLTDIYETILKDIDRDYPTLHTTLKRPKEPVYFKNLVTIVLLHELAHAALDIFNLVADDTLTEKVSYDTDFGKWREESMANAVALKIINQYGNQTLQNYAKEVMELQPAEYTLGVKMVDFESSDFDSVFNAKIYGVADELQQKWLDYAQGTPDWAGLKAWNAKINSTFLS
jgi:hypothetical protein